MQATISPPKGLSAIAAGTLTEILNMWATASPLAGDQVNVTAIVKNISTQTLAVTVAAKYDETVLPQPDYHWIDPGKNYTFTTSFTMPNKDIRLHVWSFYWTGTEWIDDDYVYLDIALGEAPPPTEEEFKNLEITSYTEEVDVGGICRVETKFDYQGPETERGLYAAIGHQYPTWFNEKVAGEIRMAMPETPTFTTYYCGVDIPITSALKPSESPFDLYAKVIDGLFPLAESERLYDVITVVAPPEEYAGTIVFSDMYKSPEGQIPFPATVVANNEYFKVFIDCKNTGTVSYIAGVELKVYDPDSATVPRASPTIDWTGISPNEQLEWEYKNFCRVDKAGIWTLKVRFLERDTSAVLDEKTLVMTATAVQYAGTITEVFINKAPEGFRIPIPTEVAIDGNTFEVGVKYRNLSGRTVPYCGPKVEIWDPDDPYHEHAPRYSPAVDWTGMSHNEELETQYNNFIVDKVGDWTIHIDFLMDSTVVVDTYDGLLFTATAVEYAGTISKKQLTYNETIGIIPVSADVPIFSRGIVTVLGRNDMTTTQRMGIEWSVKDPEGYEVEHYSAWEAWPYCPPGDEHKFDGGRFDMEKPEDWTIRIDLLMNYDNPVIVDSYDGLLCSVTEEELPPGYNEIQHTVYPYAYIYEGDAELTTATCTISPFTPSAWSAQQFANAVAAEYEKGGGRIIELKAYADTRPLLWTNLRVEVTGTPLGGGVGHAAGIGAIGIPIAVTVILIALAIIAVIVVAYNFIIKPLTAKRKPGLEDVKVGWDKETLISTIRDSEEYWERTLTPMETLEGMSEQELRDHLDQIAEEEVPSEASWLPLVIIGGVGVLGAGAAIALATRKK